MTQTERLALYLRSHPGASSLEIIRDLSITNATGRISDLRDQLEPNGLTVRRIKRSDNLDGYVIERFAPEQLTLHVA